MPGASSFRAGPPGGAGGPAAAVLPESVASIGDPADASQLLAGGGADMGGASLVAGLGVSPDVSLAAPANAENQPAAGVIFGCTSTTYDECHSLSMVGLARLDNIQACVEAILAEGIAGDFIETGCAKGGACILMRAVLRAHGERRRRVICCDAFSDSKPTAHPAVQVLAYCILRPLHLLLVLASLVPSERWHLRLYAALMRLQHHFPVDTAHVSRDTVRSFLFFLRRGHLFVKPAVPPVGTGLAAVRSHFARLGLLDEQVCFVKGFFSETLPSAPVDRLALLRLDGDLYASTMDGLVHLYPKLTPGAFCIVDDYFSFDECRQAVDEYRAKHAITAEMTRIDNMSVFWRVPA